MNNNFEDLILSYFNDDLNDTDFLFSSSSEDSSDFQTDSSDVNDTDSSAEHTIVKRRKLCRVRNYVEEIVPSYDDTQFQHHFRMSRGTCYYIIDKIINAKIMATHKFGRIKITPEKAFLMSLWYLANQESYRQIADRFNVTESAAHKHVNLVIEYLVNISNEYIKWPQEEEAEEIAFNFNKRKINGVIGAIDGIHIEILKPGKDQHEYCNREGKHSILLQSVCDDKMRFTDVFCGEAGSIDDARLLKRSQLYEHITNGNFKLNNLFLLGDSAYPNLSWLIPPFKDNGDLTEEQKTFNDRHSETRIVIENAFGLLKGRFRRLKRFENININFIAQAVVAACVLHNICINFDDWEIDFEPEEENADNYYDSEVIFNAGLDMRQQIFNQMFELN